MKLEVDENLPQDVADLLRDAGRDAASVLGRKLGGCHDSVLASVCRDAGRATLSLDLHFADIRAYPLRDYPGIIVLRLWTESRRHILAVMHRLSKLLDTEAPDRKLWIVEEDRVRIRE